MYHTKACVRLRIKGEKAPELLLELQDDDRTQTFLTQVKSVQQLGKALLSVRGQKGWVINHFLSNLRFIYRGWITLLADSLCVYQASVSVIRSIWIHRGDAICFFCMQS